MAHKTLSFDEINDALLGIDAMSETAETHGTLCGIICINGESGLNSWLTLTFDGLEAVNQSFQDIFSDLYNATFEKLNSTDYDLTLLIHPDNSPLATRTADLSLWCQGFLYGLSIAGLSDFKHLPEDTREILQDMSDISKIGYDPEEDEDTNEADFAEIQEYIRIGAYVVFNAFRNDAISDKKTVH